MNNQNLKDDKKYLKKLEKAKEKNNNLLLENDDIQKELEKSLEKQNELVLENSVIQKELEKTKNLLIENDTLQKELHTIKKNSKLEIKSKEESYALLMKERFNKSQIELENNILIQSKNIMIKSIIITLVIAMLSIITTLFISTYNENSTEEQNSQLFQKLESFSIETNNKFIILQQNIENIKKENSNIIETNINNLNTNIKNMITDTKNSKVTNNNSINKEEKRNLSNKNDYISQLIDENTSKLHTKDNLELFYKIKLLTLVSPLKYEIYIDLFKEKNLNLIKPYIFDQEMLKLYKNWVEKLEEKENKKLLTQKEDRIYENFKDKLDTFNYKNLFIDNSNMTYQELINILNYRIMSIKKQLLINNYRE